MKHLWSLNLATNFLKKIEADSLPENLNTVNFQNNQIGFKGIEDLEGLKNHPTLGSIDLSQNKIADPKILEDILQTMPNLKVVYLKGNPVTGKIKNYRKRMIG